MPRGLDAMVGADIVVVPAWNHPEQAAPLALTDALRQAHARGAQVIGLCLGAFVLGDAGLLDGKSATTHWACRELFAKRFPKTHFLPDVLYVGDDQVMTSAGTVAAIDCCLHILRLRHGADVANRVARLLVTPPHRQGGQAQYIEQPVPALPSETRLPHRKTVAHLTLRLQTDLPPRPGRPGPAPGHIGAHRCVSGESRSYRRLIR